MPPPLPSPQTRGGTPANVLDSWTRPRSLHWLARIAAVASLFVAGIWRWAFPADPGLEAILVTLDISLSAFFALEFFTRSGWKQSGLRYARWRWFDLFAIIPIAAIGPFAVTALFWLVFTCRAIRLVDRTLGDGYLARAAATARDNIEEEISDRLLAKLVSRWDREILEADVGSAIADALRRHQDEIMKRVFRQQLQNGALARVASLTGLRAAIEKKEARMFSTLISMIGSTEVDEAIRDALAASLSRARDGLNARALRRSLGDGPVAADRPILGRSAGPSPPLLSVARGPIIGVSGYGAKKGVRTGAARREA